MGLTDPSAAEADATRRERVNAGVVQFEKFTQLLTQLITSLALSGVGQGDEDTKGALQFGHRLSLSMQEGDELKGIHAVVHVVAHLMRQRQSCCAGVFHLHPGIGGHVGLAR